MSTKVQTLVAQYWNRDEEKWFQGCVRAREAQLHAANDQLMVVQQKLEVLRQLVSDLNGGDVIRIAAALEGKELREEESKILGKINKLERELAAYMERLARVRAIITWANI